MSGIPNPYETKRTPSPGERAEEFGSLLRLVFTVVGIPMKDDDAEAVDRVGVLLARKYPWVAEFASEVTKQLRG